METNTIKISSNSRGGRSVINAVTLEERAAREGAGLPYRDNRYDTRAVLGGVFPWHWHDEVECFYIREGALCYCLQGEDVLFQSGDVGFLNANVLHMTRAPERTHCIQQNHIFLPQLVCPERESDLAVKYISPLLANQRARLLRIGAGSEEAERARRLMDEAYAAARGEAWGWEFAVRACMTRLWLLFLAVMPEAEGADDSADSHRLMQMMRFISENYGQKLALRDLAGAAHISEKECERCFRRQIRMLPFDYLMDFRLDRARRLLGAGDAPITGIGERCGFSSSSYFSRCFREKYGMSPREYRSMARAAPDGRNRDGEA